MLGQRANYSVGIPARNEASTIEACVRSVYQQTLPPHCVIVCTNGCTDDTSSIVRRLQNEFPSLIHIESLPSKGHAWNAIRAVATTPFLLFVDADTTINQEAGERMFYELEKNPSLLIVGGGSLRIPPNRHSLFTRIYDATCGSVDTQRFLNGKLYMIRTQPLQALAESLRVPLLPEDVISDGHFLEKVAARGGGFRIISSAYSLCHPILSFRDWYRFRLRVSRGRRQLMKRYPHLFPDSDFLHARLRNHLHRLEAADTVLKKISSIGFAIAKECIQIRTYLEKETARSWERIDSTKRTFAVRGHK